MEISGLRTSALGLSALGFLYTSVILYMHGIRWPLSNVLKISPLSQVGPELSVDLISLTVPLMKASFAINNRKFLAGFDV